MFSSLILVILPLKSALTILDTSSASIIAAFFSLTSELGI